MSFRAGGAELNPKRVVSELRELHELTGDENGAQRLCWTPTWAKARAWFREKLEELPVEVETDAAGNVCATLPGDSERAVLIGGHIDSVPNGGWLDGVLGLLAGLEVLRQQASRGRRPLTLKLIDWADEEGARFGYGMLGSSAASGTLDVDGARTLRDRAGAALPDVVREHGVDFDNMLQAAATLENAAAYVELHIEQGSVLEEMGLPLAVVVGTRNGVERHKIRFTGQAAHVATPMADRRDPLAAAARLLLAAREAARAADAMATTGRCVARPGIATAVAGQAEMTLDIRGPDGDLVLRLLDEARETAAKIAAEERVKVEWSRMWGIEPLRFHPELIELADEAIQEVAGRSHRMLTSPLHDAAEVARAGVPTVMLFVQSLRGISHAKEEDTRPEDLELSVRALAGTVERTISWAGG